MYLHACDKKCYQTEILNSSANALIVVYVNFVNRSVEESSISDSIKMLLQ